jgi:hypothetical protein
MTVFFCGKYVWFCFEAVLLSDMYRKRTYRLMAYCYVTRSLCDEPLSSCNLYFTVLLNLHCIKVHFSLW